MHRIRENKTPKCNQIFLPDFEKIPQGVPEYWLIPGVKNVQ